MVKKSSKSNSLKSRIKEFNLSKNGRLNLSSLNLEDIPHEVFLLQNVLQLDLSNNNIKILPKRISELQHLKELTLSSNPINQLPNEIKEIKTLKSIIFVDCELKKFPVILCDMPWIEYLNFSSCEIKELPKNIEKLNLKKLWLFNCPIKTFDFGEQFISRIKELSVMKTQIIDYSFIKHLSKIDKFHIGNIYTNEFPKDFSKLRNLRDIQIGYMRNVNIDIDFSNFDKLSKLVIAACINVKLPESISEITNLTTLSIFEVDNSIFPFTVEKLVNIKQLKLRDNHKLKQLPTGIGNLKNLDTLYIYNNDLETLPVEIGSLPKLKEFLVTGNENLVSPPKSAIEGGSKAVLSYLKDLSEERKVWSSRLVVIGEGGVGKSSLIDALLHKPFIAGRETTHGLNLLKIILKHPFEPCDMELNIWDFGGQDIYHATHQFYLTNHSLFVLVWNARLGYETGKIYKWLETINALAPDSKILIVATNCAPRGADLPKGDIESKYGNKVHFFEVDNDGGLGIDSLREAIRFHSNELKYMGIGRPNSWIKSSEAIVKVDRLYLTKTELFDIFNNNSVSQDSYESLAAYLHDMGEILYYPNEDELNDTIIIKPEWVSKQIAKILDSEELSKSAGFLSKELMQVLWKDLEPIMHGKLITLMEKFDLSYKTKDDKEISLVVEKLRYEEPDNYFERWSSFKADKEIIFKYQLETIPAGIPTWFIARTHRFSVKIHWRYGALLQDFERKHLGLILCSPENKEVWLHVKGEMPYYFFAQLRDALELTFSRFKGLSRTTFVPCLGHQGKPCKHIFELKLLEKRLSIDKPKKMIECPVEIEDVDVMKMLFGLSFAPDNDFLVEQIKKEITDIIHKENHAQTIELIKFTQLEFLKSYQKIQEINDTTCPNIFTLELKENILQIGYKKYDMQLYCQMPGCCHAVGTPYEVKIPSSFMRTIGPYYNGMLKILKYTLPLVVPGAKEMLNEAQIDDLKDIVDSVKSYESIAKGYTAHDRLDEEEELSITNQIPLALIRKILEDADPIKYWGGLKRTVTPEGYILWLCEKHYNEYKN